jgi:uncharacterized membrane protein
MIKKESHTRSIVKAASWRLLATLTTIVLVWIVFGDHWKALMVGWIELVLKIVIYYGHERAWLCIGWGLKR